MFLHFKEGSNYNYPRYNGSTSVTLESFMRKDQKFIQKYIVLNHNTKDLDQERFLFANCLKGDSHIDHLNSKYALETFEIWQKRFADKNNFERSCFDRFQELCRRDDILGSDDGINIRNISHIIHDNALRLEEPEVVIWALQKFPQLRDYDKDDIILDNLFSRIRNIEDFYIWYGIVGDKFE